MLFHIVEVVGFIRTEFNQTVQGFRLAAAKAVVLLVIVRQFEKVKAIRTFVPLRDFDGVGNIFLWVLESALARVFDFPHDTSQLTVHSEQMRVQFAGILGLKVAEMTLPRRRTVVLHVECEGSFLLEMLATLLTHVRIRSLMFQFDVSF